MSVMLRLWPRREVDHRRFPGIMCNAEGWQYCIGHACPIAEDTPVYVDGDGGLWCEEAARHLSRCTDADCDHFAPVPEPLLPAAMFLLAATIAVLVAAIIAIALSI